MLFFNYFQFTWTDLIDITILFFLIYNIILLLQGTRSVQILIGLIALIAGFYAVKFLELNSTLWVLKNFFQYIVIIIIIIFQADIRNTLANFGRTRIFKKSRKIDLIDIIRITRTIEIGKQTNTGMIIVFEQQISLGEYLRTGVRIDGAISSPLLLSIFNTKSPMHDGAVVIDSNFCIAAASCILPLTSRIDLRAKYGTRHRAAIGLSEISDALILVVSEETGQITFFQKGIIKENLSVNEVERLLKNYLLNE